METRYCSKCGAPIARGFVCNKCKKKGRKEYLKGYYKEYYRRRRDEFKALREELARYKKQVEETENAN